jgi:ribonuclease T
VFHVQPFPGANIEPAALAVTGIKVDHPLRPAVPEREALRLVFRAVRDEMHATGCTRAILTGHNAFFDLNFLNSAIERTGMKRSPFHPFSSFDTATLGGVAFGQTVLARACQVAGIAFDTGDAHSAAYDAERTADLFCEIVKRHARQLPPRGRACPCARLERRAARASRADQPRRGVS